jgi:hypothetical protein
MEDIEIRINLVLTAAAVAGILEEIKNKKARLQVSPEAQDETLEAHGDTLSRQLEKR